jgi:hypothetical protein
MVDRHKETEPPSCPVVSLSSLNQRLSVCLRAASVNQMPLLHPHLALPPPCLLSNFLGPLTQYISTILITSWVQRPIREVIKVSLGRSALHRNLSRFEQRRGSTPSTTTAYTRLEKKDLLRPLPPPLASGNEEVLNLYQPPDVPFQNRCPPEAPLWLCCIAVCFVVYVSAVPSRQRS